MKTAATVVVTYRRDAELRATLARLAEAVGDDPRHRLVLVDNNADGVDRLPMASAFPGAELVRPPRNLGVTGGRNAGLSGRAASAADVVAFIDDDALLRSPRSGWTDALLGPFASDPRLGAIAFRSFVGEGEAVRDPKEFPHTDKSKPHWEAFETFRFIGVGHALRGEALREAGPYNEDFFYGMEEFDMSYRLMKAGWTIRYDPAFTVNHMRSEAGRVAPAGLARRMMANKLRVAWMHLPAGLALACAAAWTVKTALDSRGPAAPVGALAEACRWALANRGLRRPMGPSTVARIRALGGSPWK